MQRKVDLSFFADISPNHRVLSKDKNVNGEERGSGCVASYKMKIVTIY